jgi:hypothetical protein
MLSRMHLKLSLRIPPINLKTVTLEENLKILQAYKTYKIGVNMKNDLLDYLTAIALGLMLCIGLLEWFDVLVK